MDEIGSNIDGKEGFILNEGLILNIETPDYLKDYIINILNKLKDILFTREGG